MGANPNTMQIQAVWDAVYQITHYKQPVYKAFASERLAGMLKKGDTVHRDYSSNLVSNDMGADGAYSTQALSDSDETLVVNKAKEVSFYIKEIDELQSQLPVRTKYARKAMNALFLQIDADVLATLYAGASSAIDDGSIGGTSGNPISASVGNIINIFQVADVQLRLNNVVYDPNAQFTGDVKLDQSKVMPVCAISPQVYSIVMQYLGGKNSALGDKVSTNGYSFMFQGFNMFISNNLTWTGKYTFGATPTDGNTIVINGVTFTAEGTIGATPGNFLYSNATDAATNLIALINTPGTSTAQGIALSAADQLKLKNVTAVTGGAGVVVVKGIGYGNIVVSTVMTSASNKWTNQIQHNLFGVNNSVDVVIQQKPKFMINPVSGKVGSDFITWTLYGTKVFKDQSYMILDVQVDSTYFAAPVSVTY